MADWYYSKGGQQSGPVSVDQLRQMVASGQVGPQDLVWRDGMANWLPASTVPEVGGGGAPAAAPQPQYGQPAYGQPQYGQPMPGPPQYGQPVGYGGYAPPGGVAGPNYAKDAQTAMICSIIGIVCLGIILGPIGLIKGLNAKKGMAATGNFQGQGMATAAIVIGIIDILLFFGFLAIRLGSH
jgi:hypothetical protein